MTISFLLSVPLLAQESVFKSVDEDGNVSFGDSSSESNADGAGKQIEVAPTNSMTAPEMSSANTPSSADANASPGADVRAATSSRNVRVIEPEEGQSIAHPGSFSIIVELEPNLQSGQRVQFYIDGAAVGMPGGDLYYSVTNLDAGEHSAAAAVLDQNKNVVHRSTATAFTVE